MLRITLLIVLILPRPLHAAPGDLDSTFGIGGQVTTDFNNGRHDEAGALAVQPDEKIVVAGFSRPPQGRAEFALARYNVDGSLDTTFGSGGKVTTDVGGVSPASEFGSPFFALALQPDGKIIMMGTSAPGGFFSVALARYNVNGSLDTSFGSGGTVTTDFDRTHAFARALALQPDGKIVVAANSSGRFALTRFNANGSPDTSFGSGGRVIAPAFPGSGFDSVSAVALQPDGKIVLAGFSELTFSFSPAALARFNPDGSLDTSFGIGGQVHASFAVPNGKLALQPNGQILLAGFPSGHLALARFNPDGSLDTSFGSGGRVFTLVSVDHQFYSAAFAPDGKIVAAGISAGSFGLARFNPDGSLDASFGSGGKLTTKFHPVATSRAFSVAIQSDGKIVAAGWSGHRADEDFALARYQGGPTAAVELSGSGFRTGEAITYRATLTAVSTKVDVYLGALAPDGVTFISLEGPSGEISIVGGPSPIPFQANVTLTHSVVSLSYTFGGAEAIGAYFAYAGITIAGSDPLQPANQLALAIQTFELNP